MRRPNKGRGSIQLKIEPGSSKMIPVPNAGATAPGIPLQACYPFYLDEEERATSTNPEFVYESCPHCGRSHRCRPKPADQAGQVPASLQHFAAGDVVRFRLDTNVDNSSGDKVVVPAGTEAVVIQIKEFPGRIRVWVEFEDGENGWVSAKVLENIPVENLN